MGKIETIAFLQTLSSKFQLHMAKEKIPAIFKEDLEIFLKSINEYEPVINGDRICSICSKIITIDNLQLIIPRKENCFDYVCNEPQCVEGYNRNNLII